MRGSIVQSIRVGISLIAFSASLLGQAPITHSTQSNTASFSIKSPDPISSAYATTAPHDDSYVIGNDDVLSINVWKEQEVSKSLPVRSDGKISLPLVREVQAAGRTPLQLEQEIAERLQSYIKDPQVTVMVLQISSRKYNILGQVARPGSYSVTQTTTVLDAIANAGGFRDFAKKSGIYILRRGSAGNMTSLSFNYKDVIKGKNPEQNIQLQPSDTIVVP